MRTITVALLIGFLCACSSNGGGNAQNTEAPTPAQMQTTPQSTAIAMRDSTMTFKAAQAACTGALGSVTFSLGHARAHAAPGVTLDEQPAMTHGMSTLVFSNKASGKTATVEVNGHIRTVSGKNVLVKSNKSVACIGPE